MADTKISNLPSKAIPDQVDLLVIVDISDSTTKQTTVGGLKTSLDLFEPTGGLEGQVLTKNSAADYDASWVYPDSAKRVTLKRLATHAISALRVLKFDSITHVSYATSNSSYENAHAIGISLTTAAMGSEVDILVLGVLEDAFFNYPINENLYLDTSGQISNTPPVSGNLVQIGSSMGSGAIFFNPDSPISL